MQTKQIYMPPEKSKVSLRDFLFGLLAGLGLSAGAMLIKNCADRQTASGASDDSQTSGDTASNTSGQITADVPAEPGQLDAVADSVPANRKQAPDKQPVEQIQNDTPVRPAPPQPKPLTPAERRAIKLEEFKAKIDSYELALKTLLRYASIYNLTEEDETNITGRLNNLNERDFENLPDAAAIQAYEHDLSNFIDKLRGNDIDPMPR